jgi:hypothetical protein
MNTLASTEHAAQVWSNLKFLTTAGTVKVGQHGFTATKLEITRGSAENQ